MDYGQLIAEVTDRSGYSIAANARLYVQLAEIEIANSLSTGSNEVMRTVTTDASGVAELPTGFNSMRLVTANDSPVPELPLAAVKRGFGYAIRAGKMVSSYISTAHTLYYYTGLDSINDIGTNWVLEQWPAVYIEALLVQVYRAKSDEKESAAMVRFNRAIKDVVDADLVARFLSTSYRVEGPTP